MQLSFFCCVVFYSLFPLKLDRQKVAGTLMATGKTGFFGCTLLGSDGSKVRFLRYPSAEDKY